MNPLQPPKSALSAEDAREVIRVWIGGGRIHVTLQIGGWERDDVDTAEEAWARLLADVVFHLGRALEQESGYPAEFVRTQIREHLMRYLKTAPGNVSGALSDE